MHWAKGDTWEPGIQQIWCPKSMSLENKNKQTTKQNKINFKNPTEIKKKKTKPIVVLKTGAFLNAQQQ